jgi:hypothetical protein
VIGDPPASVGGCHVTVPVVKEVACPATAVGAVGAEKPVRTVTEAPPGPTAPTAITTPSGVVHEVFGFSVAEPV